MSTLNLADFADAPSESVAPLALIAPDALLKVSDSLTLGVCKRGTGEPVLARFKPGKPGKDGAADEPDAWRVTGRISDIARAIAGGLLA